MLTLLFYIRKLYTKNLQKISHSTTDHIRQKHKQAWITHGPDLNLLLSLIFYIKKTWNMSCHKAVNIQCSTMSRFLYQALNH